MTLDELKAKLDRMSSAKIRFVAQVVDALERSPAAKVRKQNTWLTGSPKWLEHFGLALSVHHGATSEPLKLTGFETVFRGACTSARWKVEGWGSPTRRFVDLVVNAGGSRRRLSLKSTAAQNLSERFAEISKLTEAAWIQDQRKPADRRKALQKLFREYTDAVDAIIMLRAFRQPSSMPYRYQLLEIPASIFESIQDAPLAVFQRDAPVVECLVEDRVAARVAVDRSDAKITIRSISLAECVVHAEWYCEEAVE